MDDNLCPICCSEYSKNVKPIGCPDCKYISCHVCIMKYFDTLLTQQNPVLSCINKCGYQWGLDFMLKHYSKSTCLGIFKQIDVNMVYQKENQLIPATQDRASEYKKIFDRTNRIIAHVSKLHQDKENWIDVNRNIINNMNQIRQVLYMYKNPKGNYINISSGQEDIMKTNPELFLAEDLQHDDSVINNSGRQDRVKKWHSYLQQQHNDLQHDIARNKNIIESINAIIIEYNLCKGSNRMINLSKRDTTLLNEFTHFLLVEDIEHIPAIIAPPTSMVIKETDTKERYFKPCVKPDCRGYISNKWKCKICDTNYCSKCLEIHPDPNQDHQCIPENIESIKLIKSDCRNCPVCRVPIYKIEGCYQMWCVNCKTPFDWGTGKVITTSFHNPHYVEYRNRAGNEAIIADQNCDQPIFNLRLGNLTHDKFFMLIFNNVQHFLTVNIPNYINMEEAETDDKLTLIRCQYICGEITKQDWITKIYQSHRKQSKGRQLNEILTTFCMVCSDLIRGRVSDIINEIEFKNQVKHITDYTINLMTKLNVKYNGIIKSDAYLKLMNITQQ